MNILARFQKLNGWQRIWIVLSTLLFIKMILLFDPRTTFEQENGYDSKKNSIETLRQVENPKCKDIISKWEKLRSAEKAAGNTENFDGVEFLTRERNDYYGTCGRVELSLEMESKAPNKSELIIEIDKISHERFIKFINKFILWFLLSAFLYGIGLLARWIRRGGL